MKNFLEIIKQRRLWAGLAAAIAFYLQVRGIGIGFDANNFTNTIMLLINDLSSLAAIVLPLLSLFNPKQ